MEKKNLFSSNFGENSDRLVLSYELLKLMEWIVEYESEAIKKIILRSLKQGFYKKLQEIEKFKDSYTTQEMQNNVVDFLNLLELLLLEATNEKLVNDVIQKNLIPSIDQVDIHNCDSSTLKSSIAVATSKYEQNSKQKAEDIFLKEFLKRWKPQKNNALN